MARVLVVDDEPSIRETLAAFLADAGHEVAVAQDVSEARALLAGERDVVVSDIILPQASGIELLRMLREKAPRVKVVLITGEPNFASAAEAVRLGAYDYLSKPVTQAAICRVVEAAAHVKAVEDENERYRERLEQIVDERTRRIQDHTERLRMVADRTRSLAQCSSLDELASRVLALFAQAMAAEGGSFYRAGERGLDLVASLDGGHQSPHLPLPAAVGTILGLVLERKEGVAIREIGEHQQLRGSGWTGYRNGSLLALPCVDGAGEVRGVVTLHNKKAPPFTEEDLEVGRIVAAHAVDAVHNLRLNEELRASENKYRQLAELSHTGIFVAREGRIVYVNPRALEIVGLDPAQPALAEGRPLLDFVWPEDRERIGREIEGFLRGERRPNRQELRVRGRGEEAVWVEALLAAVEHEGARAVLGNLLDISARRKAEQDNAKLQAQFLQAQKMEVIGRLAGGVAHDFNNLLTAFVGHSEFALQILGAEHPAREHLHEIRRAADRATALTRQLLAFARRQRDEPRLVDLNTLIEQSRRMASRLIGEDLELRFEPGAGLWPVRADPNQLDQIVFNLATNARDAMPRGGRLTITTANVPATGPGTQESVRLSVRDTGVGMAEDIRERAVEPFFTTKERGTGLGLSTAREIAERHGARLEVESSPGRGTCVSVSFPRAVGADVHPEAGSRTEDAQPGGSETILLLEDDAAVRKVARECLEARGYTVLEAGNGPEAFGIAATTTGEIALLLSDIVLPGINGWQVYEALRESRPALKPLFISGYPGEALTWLGITSRGLRLLQKPFSIETLARSVREALDAG